ncbi:Fis family transcriptional regulator [Cellulosimicrobium cellulans]|uniref:Fis family transcriptional regulator n=1 Tax=Cellulosimicrobium cellulans TaxID=1710 RepID=UPI0020CC5078|nr:Fis family transcriptional regulator [Cellulosimicrobium cellulans]
MKAMRTTGTCACGHEGVLPGRLDGIPACRACSGVRVNIDCRRCGAETELYRNQMCQRCVLADLVDAAFADPRTGRVSAQLRPVADAITSMERANSGLTWIRQKHVHSMLREVAATSPVTHASMDRLDRGRTRDYIRGLLVEHGVLEPRDELIARFTEWADDAEDRLTDGDHRAIIHRYIRWKHLRHMRAESPISNGTFLRAKQVTTVAIEYCNWLTDNGKTLASATQGDLDTWLAEGATTRLMVTWFLTWTRTAQITDPALTVPKHRRGTAARLPHDYQAEALEHVLTSSELSARNQFAALLVLIFAQPIARIVRLRWDDVTIAPNNVTMNLAGMPIRLDHPLDGPVRDLAASPGQANTAAHRNSPWIFRGAMPGNHITAMHMRQQLHPLFSSLAARLGTLTELSRQTPVAILSEALGYTAATLEKHAAVSGADYGKYISDLARA